ncbi:MAG: alpha/beta fold hydrolase [Actinomycetota bacterium]|nr:alpha/beta fold hydrolase [Actinomycetota bacterium]
MSDTFCDVMDWGTRDAAWEGVRAETISVLGRPVRVLRHGPDPAPDALAPTPQLFIHGLGGAARNWLDVLSPLSRFGETLAVDLPGFGDTPIPEGGSARVRANAGFVPALLDALGWEGAVLYGNSMGGLIATLVASREPHRVERLVLVNPALPAPRREMLKLGRPVLARILPAALPGFGRLFVELGFRAKSAEDLVDESLATVLSETARLREPYRRVLVENVERAKAEGWRRSALCEAASSLVAMIAEATELNEAVEGIEAPCLLLWGDADRLVATHVIQGLMERRPDWEQHVFAGVGHAPMIEAPDDFVNVVGKWHERTVAGETSAPAPA